MSRLISFSLFLVATFATIVHAGQSRQFPQDHIDRNDRAVIGNFAVQNYGHFKKMIHMKKIAGVVSIQEAISSNNTYAVGAIGEGRGEITVLNNEVWLDYGKDGPGNAVQEIPLDETAVLLVTAQVSKWHQIAVSENLSNNQLQAFVLEQARKIGIDTQKPFPFLLAGKFDNLDLHIISGINEKFEGHGRDETFYKQHKITKQNQEAIVIGFYSANEQGIYTHPGESWHLCLIQ